ncbi:CBS domain-containing protein [Kitasatospora sp. NPDC097643]|uniref:CBS domain-containing protein n=1 Tax=Kitasatospora sp. NPDC097643 TaxID=3157230 RepID=UPI003321A3E1
MSTVKHSILDGSPADTFPASGPVRPPGRTTVGACISRPRPSGTGLPVGVAVTPDTDFATVAAVLSASRRGIVPVVSADGTVTGVVAASDLLAAYAQQDPQRDLRARDLMTTPAITVTEETGVAAAVTLLSRNSLHHLPVVDGGGRLIGLLSAHDLLDALRRDDEAIRAEALALALTPGTGLVPGSLHIRCERGRVSVTGRTRTRGDAAALCLRIARIDGLTALTGRLSWDFDDGDFGDGDFDDPGPPPR